MGFDPGPAVSSRLMRTGNSKEAFAVRRDDSSTKPAEPILSSSASSKSNMLEAADFRGFLFLAGVTNGGGAAARRGLFGGANIDGTSLDR